MFDAAAVEVDRAPVPDLVGVERQIRILRVAEAEEVPRGVDERIHRVRLAPRRPAALGADRVDELGDLRQRRIAPAAEFDSPGQQHRQIVGRDRDHAVLLAVDDRNRRAPVALPRDAPILEAILDRAFADPARGCCGSHGLDSGFGFEAVELAGVHEPPGTVVGFLQRVGFEFSALGLHHDRHGELVFPRELEVALIVTRHPHHRAGPVLAQHEVRDPDRNRPIGERIDRRPPGVEAFLLDLASHARRAVLRLKALQRLAEVRCPLLDERMLRCQHQEVGAVDRVDPRREDVDRFGARGSGLGARGIRRNLRVRIACHAVGKGFGADRGIAAGSRRQRERHTRALRPSDPVPLHRQHFVRPAGEAFRRLEHLVGVVRDAEEPLLELACRHHRAAAPALAVDDLLVGEHRIAARAPVDVRALAVRKVPLEHLQEQPLVPVVVIGQAGRDLSLPGIADADALELALHVGDVLERPRLGMHAALDRGVLRRKPEGVPAEGMEDVEAAHALHARDDVTDHVVADVPDVGVA